MIKINCILFDAGKIEDGRVEEQESFNMYKYVLTLPPRCNFSICESKLKKIRELLSSRDGLSFYLKVGFDNVSLSFNESLTSDINRCCDIIESNDNDDVVFEIVITKNVSKQVLSIYSFNSFIEYLKNKDILCLINEFDRFILNGLCLSIIDDCSNVNVESKSIKIGDCHSTIDYSYRENVIFKSKQICNFNFSDNLRITPDDLYVYEGRNSFPEFTQVMDKLCVILCVAYISNVLCLNDNLLKYRLEGYKVINNEIEASDVCVKNIDDIFNIYKWSYESGSIVDKIGIVRNVISIHCCEMNITNLANGIFDSVKSNFIIYQKQNLKQYIEIRNKLGDSIHNFVFSCEKLIEDFLSDFKKLFFVFVSFFATIILARVISGNNLNEIFTFEITLLSIVILTVSMMVLNFLYKELNGRIDRVCQDYLKIKESYKDLLDEKDIEKIVSSRIDFEQYKKELYKRCVKYYKLWFWVISIFSFVVWSLCVLRYSKYVTIVEIKDWFLALL